MISFTQIFKVFAKSLSNLVHDFWEDCFFKPKLLLAANRLICSNLFKNSRFPAHSCATVFYLV